MTDFSKLLNAVIGGDFTLEQLAELQSVLTKKQEVKEKKLYHHFFTLKGKMR